VVVWTKGAETVVCQLLPFDPISTIQTLLHTYLLPSTIDDD
jgi:hypothetical protein